MSLDLVLEQTLEQDVQEYSVLQMANEAAPAQKTRAWTNKVAAELAAARYFLEPDKSMSELYEDSKVQVSTAEDPRALFAPLKERARQVSTDVLKSQALDRIRAGEDANVVLNGTRVFKSFFDENNQIDANVIINGVQRVMPVQQYEQMNLAADARPFQLMQEQISKEGREDLNFEDFVDWTSMFFVPDSTSVQDPSITARLNKLGVLGEPVEKFSDIGVRYKTLTPNQKEQLWEQLFPIMWEEYDGNIPKIASAIGRVMAFDPEHEQTVAKIFDALTSAGNVLDGKLLVDGAKAVAGITKAGVLTKLKAASSVNALRSAKQNQAAADLLMARTADAGAPLEAAKNLAPTKFEGTVLDTGLTYDGLSPEIAARMRQNPTRVSTAEEMVTEAEKAYFQQKAAELDLWAEERLSVAGGAKAAKVQKELDQINENIRLVQADEAQAARKLTTSGLDRREMLIDLQAQAARLEEVLSALEDAALAKRYAKSMRLGKVPDEFAEELAAEKARAAKLFSDSTTELTGTAKLQAMKGGRFSADPELNKIVEEGVSGTTNLIKGYADGTAFINVARATFERQKISAEKARYAEQGRVVRSEEVVEVSPDGVKIKYTLDDGTETIPYEWNRDALGAWHSDALDKSLRAAVTNVLGGVLSPSAAFKHLTKDMVSNFTLGGLQTARVYNNLLKAAKEINKLYGLSSKQAENVEALLKEGDLLSRSYTAEELLYSKVALQREWDPEEVMAYFGWRNLYDGLWQIQNNAARRSLEFQGYRELHITGLGDAPVQTVAREASAKDLEFFAPKKKDGSDVAEEVLVVGGPEVEKIAYTKDGLAAAMQEGFEVFKLYTKGVPVTRANKVVLEHDVRYVLIKRGEHAQVKPLRNIVLHYEQGYIPRMYEPGMFYVKDQYFRTYAAFNGRKAAVQALQRAEQAKEAGYLGKNIRLSVIDDAEMAPEVLELDRIQGAGGLWYMPRRGKPLRLGEDATKFAPTVDLGQSTQMYLAGIAELLPLNEYRAGVLQQFRRAADEVAKRNGRQEGAFSNPDDVLGSSIQTGEPAADALFRGTREYLSQQLHNRSIEEGKFSAFMGKLVDVMEGNKWLGGKVRDAAKSARYNLRPLDRAKGAVFHAYLGCMNFAQLFVQAQNAVHASLIYPQYAVQSFNDALWMNALLLMDDAAIDALAAQSKIPLGGYKAGVAMLKRTGYLDSIFRSADWKTSSAGLSHGTMELARKALRTGAKPFEAGEAFARIMAFNLARRKYLASNPGKKVLDDVDMQAIVQDSLRISMNMQKENAAVWQLNGWGVPFQFFQVQAKWMENLVGAFVRGRPLEAGESGLTKGEAVRAGLGQLGMYGLVAVPLGYQIVDVVARGYGYVTADGTPDRQSFFANHPDAAELWSEGAMGYALSLFGINANVSERFSLAAGIDNNIVVNISSAILNEGKVNAQELAPLAGMVVRVDNSIDRIAMALRALWHTPESSQQQMLEMVDHLGRITSSWNNRQKLRLWQKRSARFSQSARPLYGWDEAEMNYQTQLAAGLGFTTDSEFWTFHSLDAEADIQETEDHAQELVRQAILAWIDKNYALHQEYMEAAEDHLSNPGRWNEIRDKAFKQMYGDTTQERVRQDMIKRLQQGYGSDLETNVYESMNNVQ